MRVVLFCVGERLETFRPSVRAVLPNIEEVRTAWKKICMKGKVQSGPCMVSSI
jgi:hypothetical protein